MKYFSYISWRYSTKNKLDEAIMALLEVNNRKVIPEDELEYFKNGIISDIKLFEAEHPKCKSKKASWFLMRPVERDWAISGFGGCNFYLYSSKKND